MCMVLLQSQVSSYDLGTQCCMYGILIAPFEFHISSLIAIPYISSHYKKFSNNYCNLFISSIVLLVKRFSKELKEQAHETTC